MGCFIRELNDHSVFRTVAENHGTPLSMAYFKGWEVDVRELGYNILEDFGNQKRTAYLQRLKLPLDIPDNFPAETDDQVYRAMKNHLERRIH